MVDYKSIVLCHTVSGQSRLVGSVLNRKVHTETPKDHGFDKIRGRFL